MQTHQKKNYKWDVCVLATIASGGNQANFSKLITDQASNLIIDFSQVSNSIINSELIFIS